MRRLSKIDDRCVDFQRSICRPSKIVCRPSKIDVPMSYMSTWREQIAGHIVEKSGISLSKAGQNFWGDIKLAEHYYCVACVLLYSYCSMFSPTVACLRHTTRVRILNVVYT